MNTIALAVNPALAGKISGQQENSKGSILNRAEYGLKQYGNFAKTYYKTGFIATAGVAGTAAAAVGVAKSKTAQNVIVGGIKKVLNNESVKKGLSAMAEGVKPLATKALTFVKSNPKAALAAGVVIAAGTAITSMVTNKSIAKGIYDAGKIDQQYTDKAKVDKLFA